MSGGANKSFLANPVNWMRNNVLLIDIQSMIHGVAGQKYDQGALVTCNIEKDASRIARRAGGGTIPVYRIKEATGRASLFSHRFSAYYLPFRSNAVRSMVLDPATFPPGADYFFTDTVNGCSFAAGPGQHPKTSHINRTLGGVDPGAGIDQPAMNADIVGEFPGGTAVRLRKATYKPNATSYATVFGVRNGANWTFYWQGPREWVGILNGEKEWELPAGNILNVCDNHG